MADDAAGIAESISRAFRAGIRVAALATLIDHSDTLGRGIKFVDLSTVESPPTESDG